MELWPAIDIRDGRCVRLRRGDFANETVFGDPVDVAVQYLEAGAERLHVVDLDAARTGTAGNRETVLRIVRQTGLQVQAGGGVRDVDSAAALLESGVSRVVVGTAAFTGDAALMETLLDRWPGRVVLGLDYRTERSSEGRLTREIAIRGWTENVGLSLEAALERAEALPCAAVVVTDIGRDGTGVGPDLVEYGELLGNTALPLVASGGIGSAADIARLARLDAGGRKLAGVVVGKALLSGTLTLADARQAALGLTR